MRIRDTRERVRETIITRGASRAARDLGIRREVLLAIAAGARVREASLVMAEVRLDQMIAREQSTPQTPNGAAARAKDTPTPPVARRPTPSSTP
jgi:hypothetical protein